MDKMKMQTSDLADENFRKLKELFPNAVTETIDENGEVVRAIDKDVLRQEINAQVVEGPEERYQFTWSGKRESIRLAAAPIAAALRPCREESVNFDTTENVYIEGDNLDVLKLLRETYLGRIKLIYIDPPYNTGNDFIYKDDLFMEGKMFFLEDGQKDEMGNRLVQNLESNGRFHTDWLKMMYPRLRVAKDLLSEDGVIFISIDENEIANLKKIADDVFGESNCLSIIENTTGASQNGEGVIIQSNYEFCLVYARSIENVLINKVDKADESLRSLADAPSPLHTRPDMGYSLYFNPETNQIIPMKDYNKDLIQTNDESKVYTSDKELVKKGFIPVRPGKKNGLLHRWRWGFETCVERLSEIVMQRGRNGYVPYFKQKGFNPPKNTWNYGVGTNQLKDLFGDNRIFDFSKSPNMLKYIINIGASPDSIILDFFSGSATTAHAMMELNSEDGGNRKFILVQVQEPCREDSDAARAGYKTICEVGKERIRRAGKKIKENNPLVATSLDTGFRVFKLDSSNMKDVYYSPADTPQKDLLGRVDNIKEGRTPEDLLFQVMLEFGIPLSSKIKESVIAGKKVFHVEDNYLIACFDDAITEESITAIAKEKPQYVVLRDSGFKTDSVAANFEQIFATYSPDTTRRIL